MVEWIGPIFKKLAASEIGSEHGHTSGIVPYKNTEAFFGKPNKEESHEIKKIFIQFVSDKLNTSIKTNLQYYKSDTHKHMHLTGNLMPTYQKAGAEEGDILLFWKSKKDDNLFRVQLVKEKELGSSKTLKEIEVKLKEISSQIDLDSDEYQTEGDIDEEFNDTDFPTEKRKWDVKKSSIKLLPRSKIKGDYVIKKNGYKCMINSSHETFVAKNGKKYMEKHHLIPMKFFDRFENSLDDIRNIISLCPNCHRMIHFGCKECSIKIIESLWKLKNKELEEAGLQVTFEELKEMYGY